MRISVATPRRRTTAGVLIVLAGAILLGAGPPAPRMSPAAVDLGAAAPFAVLAGGGITDTGPSTISGDVGSHPLPTIPDLLDKEASGSVYRAGAKPGQAQRDLANAFASVAALPRDDTFSFADDRTLPPGVYAVADATLGLAGSLTLDGQGAPDSVWIFVVANDLVIASGSTITLINGAQACNVFWRVGGSATLAPGSTFAGSIIAMTSVTVGRGVAIEGRLLARTAAVSLGGNRIVVPVCVLDAANSAPQPAVVAALPQSSRTSGAAGGLSEASSFLPIVVIALLVAAAILGEPRHRKRRRAPRSGW